MEDSIRKVIDLLYLAKQNEVEVILNEGRLQLKIAENKKVNDSLLAEIRNNKQLIIDFLSNDQWKSVSVTGNYNKIKRFDRNEITHIPLSFSQERLWFIDQLEGSVQYHAPILLRLNGKLNVRAITGAFQSIITRQEVLRTVYKWEDGKVYQQVKDAAEWELEIIDGSKYTNDEKGLQELTESLIRQPFNLSKDYMLRAELITIDDVDNVLVVTMHHIASDASSNSILVQEMIELYGANVENRQAQLPELALQYADFAVWQRDYLKGDILETKLAYWKQKLDGVMPLKLPVDFDRPLLSSTRGASAYFTVDKKLTGQLNELSRQQGVSLFMTMLSVFKILLYRYSGQSDINVGTSIANRPQQEIEGLVGFFVNTLSLRSEVNGDDNFLSLLQKVRATTMEAYDHQDVPFEKIVEAVVKERDSGKSSLFQVMLVLQNSGETPELKLGDLAVSALDYEHTTTKFDFTFFLNETPTGIRGNLEYSTDLYKADTINKMTEHYKILMQSIVDAPEQKISQLPMLTQGESHQLLEEFNTAHVDFPKDKSVVAIFEEQALQTPGNTALVFEEETMTYRQLNERANQLAHYLTSRGVTSETLVPLYVERGLEMMVGMLGIMKAGGAYVPVDTDFPSERIGYMLENTGAKIMVSSSNSSGKLEIESGVAIIETDNIGSDLSKENLPIKPLANHLAYVIYTSGSTGKPKGVMIEHRSLLDYYYGLNKYTPIAQSKSFALVSTIATDLGNTVIYASLLSGGTLHLFTKETVSNIEALHHYFAEHKIDCLKIVPSHWKALSQDEGLLLPKKLLVFGGEALPSDTVEDIRLSGAGCIVVNHYGPTETTIGKLLHVVNPANTYEKTIPIGKPFSNTKVYVLSKELQPCPVGVPGQLYISGDGVARGYYNNAALTKEKFIINPFNNETEERMYATGDQVKFLADGNIAFLGRVDDQVKIRGYRIELGEIESILQQVESVSQAVVLAKDDKQGNKRLVGYIVPRDEFDKEAIVTYLKGKLPDYMIPGVLVELESLPLTANGKVDRKALPDPEAGESASGQYVAPRNETEATLAAIWEDVLEVEQVGVHDDFFELGGHSLLAVRLVAAIRKTLQIELPLNDIFIYPTIADLAGNILEKTKNPLQPEINIKYLVPIKTSGKKVPLYIICGGGGTARRFRKFAEMMDEDQPVYALQPIVDDKEVLNMGYSMEDIAGKFIEEIRIGNPDGPYALSGHCTGGIIAFEMTKQLEAMGKKVHILAMFDTVIRKIENPQPPSFNNFYNIPHVLKGFISKAMLKLDFETYLLRKYTRKAIGYKVNSFKTMVKKMKNRGKPAQGLEYAGLEIFNESSQVYRNAIHKYKLQPYGGELLLFYAKERYYFTDVNNNIRFKKVNLSENTKNLWCDYAATVTIFEVEGDHSDIFETTHGNQFAMLLQEKLNKPVTV